ncbi:hypothetical protein BBG03_03450 [Streptococcus dysgalactiae subsp. equisimilis]|uniref:hypothetical protein n=1 Tax=Streptococcus dysgalactiae TaxID=1334 RepID=UPI000806FF82|nr:hypothetical protein [Streptococcus dysgalactiae]OBZ00651.1 hypothetical protein BBG03_03450 [Streptococcus dysgalactiae subsp. equisimilis]
MFINKEIFSFRKIKVGLVGLVATTTIFSGSSVTLADELLTNSDDISADVVDKEPVLVDSNSAETLDGLEPVTTTPSEPREEPVTTTPSEPREEPVTTIPSEPREEPVIATPSEPREEPVIATPSEPREEPVSPTPSEPQEEPVSPTPSEPQEKPVSPTPSTPQEEPVVVNPVENPIEISQGKIVGTQNGSVVIQGSDGLVNTLSADSVGGSIQEDGTILVKDSTGKLTRLPNTGQKMLDSFIMTVIGVISLLGVALIKLKNALR